MTALAGVAREGSVFWLPARKYDDTSVQEAFMFILILSESVFAITSSHLVAGVAALCNQLCKLLSPQLGWEA